MKKLLAFLAAAAILFSCGCGSRQAGTDAQTEPVSAPLTNAPIDEDMALPADVDDFSTTAPFVPPTTQSPMYMPTTAPTTAAPETTTAAPATDKPTDPTEKPKTAENFEKRVVEPVNSGKYTMTLGAIGKDRKNEDKIVKTARDGETAYMVTVPAGNLNVRVFPNGGKYYAAIPGKYSELTKEQYDALSKRFDNAFGSVSAHQYQDSKSVRERLRRYTIENFDLEGKPVSYWFENGSLFRREMDGVYQPISVSNTAMNSYFDLEKFAEEIDGETMAPVLSLAGAFFE